MCNRIIIGIIILVISFIFINTANSGVGYEVGADKDKANGIKAFDTATQNLKTSVEQMLKENEQLKIEAANQQSEINRATDEKNSLYEKLKTATEENNKLKGQIANLQDSISEAQNKKTNSEQDNQAKSKKIAELEGKVQLMKEATDNANIYKQSAEELSEELRLLKEKENRQASQMEQQKTSYEQEIKDLKETIDKFKESNIAYLEDKKTLESKLEEAQTLLATSHNKLKKLDKETQDVHYNLGRMFQESGEWKKAIVEYKKVLIINPDDAQTHFNLALIYDTIINDREKAVFHYKKYVEINPKAPDVSKVKKYITELNTLNKIWGEPKSAGVKEDLGRHR